MSYRLKIDFNYIRCYKKTLETSSDEIGLLAVGCDQDGHFTFYRPRIIVRDLQEGVSNSQKAITPDMVDTTLVDIPLNKANQTGFLLALWMFESDNRNFLIDTWDNITSRIVNQVNLRSEELRKIGVPDAYRTHMAFSETFYYMHLNMASGIGENVYTRTGLETKRTGALVLHELFHPVLWRFTHPGLLTTPGPAMNRPFPLPNYESSSNDGWLGFNLGHVSMTNFASSQSESLYSLRLKVVFKNLSPPVLNA